MLLSFIQNEQQLEYHLLTFVPWSQIPDRDAQNGFLCGEIRNLDPAPGKNSGSKMQDAKINNGNMTFIA